MEELKLGREWNTWENTKPLYYISGLHKLHTGALVTGILVTET